LALHGAPVTAVRIFKQDAAAQGQLLCWLEAQGMNGVASIHTFSDHSIAACASAFAAWKWASSEAKWLTPAAHPFHPFAFTC
jgi:hypothetical protein